MDERKPLILIVEDDEEMARFNARLLMRQGYDALTAFTAAVAQSLFSSRRPDLLVLDIELPDGDGRSLCRGFRRESDTPVLFLTGRGSTDDRIEGLDAGGDYYLTKPYDRDEFLAVVKSLMRRVELARKKVEEAFVIRRGPLTLMLSDRKAFVNGRDAGLTPKEFAVLLLLVQNEDSEIPCEHIYQSVWGIKMNDDPHPLRLHISRLKKKLGERETGGFYIFTGYRKGYSFTLQ
ncbi:MAG: response regulator transcription factor [Clostridiales bacterium]|nr:response regulator transcription factor [Clostridiales bacterium]